MRGVGSVGELLERPDGTRRLAVLACVAVVVGADDLRPGLLTLARRTMTRL